jgi:hypothetical protein
MNGTADDVEMLNYYNRTIEPIMDAITEAIARTFLTKTARTQGQTIMYFQTPFKLIPISQLGKLIDVLSRNQIVTPNEIRPALGLKPSGEPQAISFSTATCLLTSRSLIQMRHLLDRTGHCGTAGTDPAAAQEAELQQQMADLGIT